MRAMVGRVVTRDQLLNEVWGYQSYPLSRTVDNRVAALPAKLENIPSCPAPIHTVHDVGCKFEP
jgi:two-component system response regulator VicR